MSDKATASLSEMPEMNPGPVCRLDLEGAILLANSAARDVFDADDLSGRSWFELCPQLAPELWDDVCEGANSRQYEATIDGRDYSFTMACRERGEDVFVYGSDVTELKEAERNLEQQAAELAEMARFPEMNPGPVCRLDHEARVVLANTACRKLFGDEDLVGKCWLDLPSGMTHDQWDRVLSAGRATVVEVRLFGRDMVLTYTPGPEGRHIFVFGTDTTEQQAAERALRQSEKMATLGTLAAGVAHELNNPAAAALRAAEHLDRTVLKLQEAGLRLSQLNLSASESGRLFALDEQAREGRNGADAYDPLELGERQNAIEEWLDEHGVPDSWEIAPVLAEMDYDDGALNELADGFTADHLPAVMVWLGNSFPVHNLLEEIAHGSGRISEIVGALKAYSYLGQGAMQSVDVNEGLRHTLIILRNKLKAGVTVDTDFDEDLPTIMAYGSELNQVWTNLIDNAAAAMDGRGRIWLRTSLEGEWVVVEVEDEGSGIAEENLPRIYDPFFTTKAPGEGTGLGLNTTYNIVTKKHRGQLDVVSRPGKTVFTVKLPLDSRDASGGMPAEGYEPSAAGSPVLPQGGGTP